MTTCLTHEKDPDLKNCPTCRKELEEVIEREEKQLEILRSVLK